MIDYPVNTPELSAPPTDAEFMALGAACMATSVELEMLARHEQLIPNPNRVGPLAVPFRSGEIPTQPDMIYRQVGIEAVQDLAQSGIVRNGATARGESHPRWEHGVFWSEGSEGAFLNTAGRAVLVAPKSATEKGWVTAQHLSSIYAKSASGELVDLLASQPKTTSS